MARKATSATSWPAASVEAAYTAALGAGRRRHSFTKVETVDREPARPRAEELSKRRDVGVATPAMAAPLLVIAVPMALQAKVNAGKEGQRRL